MGPGAIKAKGNKGASAMRHTNALPFTTQPSLTGFGLACLHHLVPALPPQMPAPSTTILMPVSNSMFQFMQPVVYSFSGQ